MLPVEIVAVGAISALGESEQAYAVGEVGEAPRCGIGVDPELRETGLAKPLAARARLPAPAADRDRATALLLRAWELLRADLDDRAPSWESQRLALVLGTSGGGMPSLERVLAARAQGQPLDAESARRSTYFGPFLALLERAPAFRLRAQVLGACASSTMALGLASRWLELDRADLVIAGGYDALSAFIAAGFEALGATTAAGPAPFRIARDGMALGEGAALVALARRDSQARPTYGTLLGFGCSSDAVHITAPDRTGSGLERAARQALDDAGTSATALDVVNAHATATPYNDAAETQALLSLLGPASSHVVVHAPKAALGHTLGAAGVLETLAGSDGLRRAVLPASCGEGPLMSELPLRVPSVNEAGRARRLLKLSAAFGGANAALVLGDPAEVRPRPRYPVFVQAVGDPVASFQLERVARQVAWEAERLMRLDPVSELVLTAVASLVERLPERLSQDAGLVLGTMAASLEVNERFDARRRVRGARLVEPRWFPPTSPNLACGQASIAFGLRGPAFAVGASGQAAQEALLVAHDLIAAGDAASLVVVAADLVGPVVQDIWQAAGWPAPSTGAAAVLLSRLPSGAPVDDAALVEAAAPRPGAEQGWSALLTALRKCAPSADLPGGPLFGSVAPPE